MVRLNPMPVSTLGAPALASFNDQIAIAWTQGASTPPFILGPLQIGFIDHPNLSYTYTDASGKLQGNPHPRLDLATVQVNDKSVQSVTGPALASYNGKLFIAWSGTTPFDPMIGPVKPGPIYVASSSDGKTFSNLVTLVDPGTGKQEQTTYAPALETIDDPESPNKQALVVAWTGTNGNLNTQSTFDGTTAASFGNKYVAPERASDGPVLFSRPVAPGINAGWNCWLAWNDVSHGSLGLNPINFEEIYYLYNGAENTGTTLPAIGSGVHPGVAYDKTRGTTTIAYQGNQHHISFMSGTEEAPTNPAGHTDKTGAGPALLYWSDGTLYCAFAGDGDVYVWFQNVADMQLQKS